MFEPQELLIFRCLADAVSGGELRQGHFQQLALWLKQHPSTDGKVRESKPDFSPCIHTCNANFTKVPTAESEMENEGQVTASNNMYQGTVGWITDMVF